MNSPLSLCDSGGVALAAAVGGLLGAPNIVAPTILGVGE